MGKEKIISFATIEQAWKSNPPDLGEVNPAHVRLIMKTRRITSIVIDVDIKSVDTESDVECKRGILNWLRQFGTPRMSSGGSPTFLSIELET